MTHPPKRDKISLLRVKKNQSSLSFADLEIQLNNAIPEVRRAALPHLIRMGETGITLVLSALKDPVPIVVWEAYCLLRSQYHQQVKSTLTQNSPYRSFNCIAVISGKPEQLACVSLAQLNLMPEEPIIFLGDTGGCVQTFSLSSQRKINQLQAHIGEVTALTTLPNYQNLVDGFPLLLTGGRDRVIRLWKDKVDLAIATFTGHTDWISDIAVAPCTNGAGSAITRFLTASRDSTIKLWSLQSPCELATLTGHQYSVSSVAFSPDGQIAVSGSLDQKVKVWHLQSKRLLRTLEGHEAAVFSVATAPEYFSSNKERFLVASAGLDGIVRVWQGNEGHLLKSFSGHQEAVTSLAFSPDGLILASSSGDRTVRLWDVISGKSINVLRGHKSWISKVAFSPDGRLLTSCSDDGTIRIWGLSPAVTDPSTHT